MTKDSWEGFDETQRRDFLERAGLTGKYKQCIESGGNFWSTVWAKLRERQRTYNNWRYSLAAEEVEVQKNEDVAKRRKLLEAAGTGSATHPTPTASSDRHTCGQASAVAATSHADIEVDMDWHEIERPGTPPSRPTPDPRPPEEQEEELALQTLSMDSYVFSLSPTPQQRNIAPVFMDQGCSLYVMLGSGATFSPPQSAKVVFVAFACDGTGLLSACTTCSKQRVGAPLFQRHVGGLHGVIEALRRTCATLCVHAQAVCQVLARYFFSLSSFPLF